MSSKLESLKMKETIKMQRECTLQLTSQTWQLTSTEKPNGIEIQAVPESNDIVALRDLYLSLSMENTLVNIIEDSISSGEELSGSNYTVTSSYTNGKFTR